MKNSNEYRVLIGKDLHDAKDLKTFSINDPRTGRPSSFILGPQDNNNTDDTITSSLLVLELQRFKPQHSSWFIGDSVIQDGSIYMATPIDPLFLILPLLEKSSSMFCDAEQLCEAFNDPQLSAYLSPAIKPQLPCICETKEAGGEMYYRLSEERTLAWLKCKVKLMAAFIRETQPSFAAMDDDGLSGYAAGLMGEYMSLAWSEKLLKSLNIQLPSVVERPPPQQNQYNNNNNNNNGEDANKRMRLDPKEIAKQKATIARQQAKQEKLAKEASGMRKLSAFFTKKPSV